MDYVCPFSAKMYKTLYESVLPNVEKDKVAFIFRHQVQPWHPSSTLVHETGIAVSRLAPNQFWEFSDALFRDSAAYYDVCDVSSSTILMQSQDGVAQETRDQTYERLAQLAHTSVGLEAASVLDLLKVRGGGNAGNAVTPDLKLQVRYARQNSIHMSPTVIVNGIIDSSISSSFTAEQWSKLLSDTLSKA